MGPVERRISPQRPYGSKTLHVRQCNQFGCFMVHVQCQLL